MTEYDIANIKNFITKFKNTTDLNQPYLEFNLYWLNSFNKNLSNNVLYEFDCIRDERINRECEITTRILRKFIISLEVMLAETR